MRTRVLNRTIAGLGGTGCALLIAGLSLHPSAGGSKTELSMYVTGAVMLLMAIALAAFTMMRHPGRALDASDPPNRATTLQTMNSSPGAVQVAGNQTTQIFHATIEPYRPRRPVVNVAPKYFSKLFEDHIALQAKKLTAAYMGQWMRLSGSVSNVTGGGSTYVVTMLEYGTAEPFVLFLFESSWAERLHLLKKQEKVTIEGKISEIGSTTLSLEECELIDD